MRPKRLGERSLVVACSHSGNTPEVIRSCKIAHEAGAAVITFTNQEGSGIDLDLWTSWVYPWSDDVLAAQGPRGHNPASRRRAARPARGLCRPQRPVRGRRRDGPDPARRTHQGERGAGGALRGPVPGAPVPLHLGFRSQFLSRPTASPSARCRRCSGSDCAYIHRGSTSTGRSSAPSPACSYFLQMGSSECRAMDERALAFLEDPHGHPYGARRDRVRHGPGARGGSGVSRPDLVLCDERSCAPPAARCSTTTRRAPLHGNRESTRRPRRHMPRSRELVCAICAASSSRSAPRIRASASSERERERSSSSAG